MDDKNSICRFFLFLFLLGNISLSAQNSNSQEYSIDQLIRHTNRLYMDGKTDEVLSSAKKIISLSEHSKYDKGLSYGYYYLASYFYDNAKFRESVQNVKKAQQYTKYLAGDKTQSARISALLGGNYLLLELYTLSSKNYRETIDILQSKSPKNTTDSLTESATYSNMSYLFQNINMPDSMYYYLKKEKSILKKIKFKDAYVEKGCSCLGFGNYHLNENKIDSAQYYYNRSLEFFNDKKHPCKIESLIGLGNLYTHEKDYQKAHEYYNFALNSFEENNFPDIQGELFKKISELYISQGNASEAKKYQDLYLKLHTELDGRKKKERDFVLNEVMKEEKAQHDKEVRESQKLTLLIASLLILITAFIIYLLKKSKSKNQKALEITKQLQTEKAVQEKEKVILKLQVNEAFEDVRKLAKENNSDFFTRFQEVYPHFTLKMLNINPKFKVSELTFAAYIYLGFNTKEIAEYTFKAVKTIENNRYNLRKKLEISPEKDLQIWLRNYIDSE
ncbi:tetratricopeptide repeat protein [Chryseobacterium sp. PBS4-4]|uniref:Tetratricopeptide repeat protein n=1 Tax=Chryseobacterium edaphi TaxID=2976532 RepID=A0ABT2W5S3_9FLAO|nr:tetratricopeptide repeat protein [Chryseobacterium edaphi]MCU7617547.1 tetratricopeptide repeat protein [Chryseobacterium edaphi]